MPKETEAQRRANYKYKKENCSSLSIRLFPADADIKEWLAGVDEKAKYIKRLIREDMKKEGR